MAAISSSDGKVWLGKTLEKLKKNRPIDTVLDIGVGEGGYSDLYRKKVGKHWTGVEIFEPYIDQFDLVNKYDVIIADDARNLSALPSVNLAFCGDVLEHLSKEDAKILYNHLLNTCDFVTISLPIIHFPQGSEDGNDHQAHLVDWSHDEILSEFDHIQTWYRGKVCGVYIASQKHTMTIPTHTFPKIAVYTIAKNELGFVDRMVSGAAEADVILIADTGSDDGTYERLQELGATQPNLASYRISVSPWRFDTARNAALALIPDDVDLCISVDMDEVLQPGWRQEIENNFQSWHTRMFYWFAWAKNTDGTDKIAFWGDKAHARHGYRWVHPVHETIEPYGITEQVTHIGMKLDHYPDNSKSRGQYLPLLELSVKETPTHGKNSLYLGREYFFYSRFDEAIKELTRYLSLVDANWQPDRASAYRYIAKAYAHKGEVQNAGTNYLRAVSVAPEMRETWGDLVQHYYALEDWTRCYEAAKSFLAITTRTDHYLYEPKFYGAFGHDMLAISAWHLGLRDEAISAAAAAVASEPGDQRLHSNLAYMLAN